MKLNRLTIACLLLSQVLIAWITPYIRDTAYSNWTAFREPGEFVQRVDEALAANPFAIGNGAPAIQGVNTVLCTPDLGAGVCLDSTGTLVGLASPIAETITSSSTSPLSLTADASAGATGVLFTQANGNQTATNPELSISYSSTAGTNGCPDTGSGSTNALLQVTGAVTTHSFIVKCNGDVSIKSPSTNALVVNGSAQIGGAATGTTGLFFPNNASQTITENCQNTTACEYDVSSVTSFKNNGGISGAGVNYKFFTGATPSESIDILGNGGLTLLLGDLHATVGNISADGVANATGEIRSGGAANVTGAKGIGAVVMGGMPYSGTFCSGAQGTTSAGTPTSTLTTLTTGQWNCPITSGSATATIFSISMPGAVTLSNPASCTFTTAAASAVEPMVTSTTTLCTLTYTVAPGAVLLGRLIMMGNGP
jgi:hypothetical protein